MRRSTIVLAGWLFMALPLAAQQMQPFTLAGHNQRLGALRALAQACLADSSACAPEKVGPDERLTLSDGVESQVRFDWLRQALAQAKQESAAGRSQKMNAVIARLTAAPAAGSSIDPAQARKQADAILARAEFADAKPSWLGLQWDKLTGWFFRHIGIGDPSVSARQWISVIVEVLLFGIPLTLLGVWIARQVREDRIVPEFARESRARRQSTETDWRNEAQRWAAAGDWREAIHALYWYSIAMFEQRHQWPAARNRTPREYLALLEPGSRKRSLLREKTAMLEAVWYGHREATEADFRQAERLTEELALA